MPEKNAYLKINPPKLGPDALDADAAREHLRNRVEYQDLANLINDAQKIGGGMYKVWSHGLGLIPEDQPTDFVRDITMDKIKEALNNFLWNIYDDIIPLIPDDTVEINLEYDPSEWFADENTRMGTFVSGRLFCLAHTGVLQAMGFRVEGTGLPAVEPAEE